MWRLLTKLDDESNYSCDTQKRCPDTQSNKNSPSFHKNNKDNNDLALIEFFPYHLNQSPKSLVRLEDIAKQCLYTIVVYLAFSAAQFYFSYFSSIVWKTDKFNGLYYSNTRKSTMHPAFNLLSFSEMFFPFQPLFHLIEWENVKYKL